MILPKISENTDRCLRSVFKMRTFVSKQGKASQRQNLRKRNWGGGGNQECVVYLK